MGLTSMSRNTMKWVFALAAGAALGSPGWAQNPADSGEQPATAAATVKSWESAEERLTMLLDKVPEQARSGIERALEANREGRLNAQEALNRGDERRAQRALEVAASRAETGLNQARARVPESVLPQLEEAAARMSVRGNSAIARSRPSPTTDPTSVDRPPIGRPVIGVPGNSSRPDTAGRPPQPGRP